MSRVGGSDTAPEMAVRRTLHGMGYRFQLHRKDLPGRPDIVFPSRRKVIFVHGCFWHGHGCTKATRPTSNVTFWNAKLDRNAERDRENCQALKKLGWHRLELWECETGRGDLAPRLRSYLGPTKLTRTKLSCIESFSGAGGMSLGLSAADIDVRLAFDIDPFAIQTYQRNVDPHGQVLDVRQVNGGELLRALGLDRIDVLSGGPPCQGFSKQNRGAHENEDERNDLILEFARLVRETRARSFIFENVEIFGQKRGREFIGRVERDLTDYRIFRFFVCASDFGLAQRRGRFLMLGFQKDEPTLTPVLGGSGMARTIRDVIGNIPPPPDDYTEHPSIPNHIKCRISKLNEERIRYVRPGGGWTDIPKRLRLDCHIGVDTSKGGWPDVYGRLEWGGQCPTITAGFDSFTRGRYAHPEQHRSLTLHEGAQLQGFPANFRFYGTRYDMRVQIGNAVPPPVAKAAGEAVRRVLEGDASVPQFPIYPEGCGAYAMAAE